MCEKNRAEQDRPQAAGIEKATPRRSSSSMKYRLLKDAETCEEAKVGATVFDCNNHDYGLANDDTRLTGIEHKSVTLKEDGGYPFFTVPTKDLEEI